MSASNEENIQRGPTDPKTAREAQQRKAEKRSNTLYAAIAVVFVVFAAAAIVWRSNVIPRTVAAATVNGEKYNAAEVNFYYQNAYQNFVGNYSSMLSYIGLNTNAPLESQVISEDTAAMTGLDAGMTWHDFFMDQALSQIATVQATLDAAEAEGFVFSDSLQTQYNDSMEALAQSAASNGLSVKEYLQTNLGSIMTEKIYGEQLMRMLKYSEYVDSVQDSMTYTDAELEAAYAESPESYDRVSYEVVTISGTAPSTTDADGKTVAPTEEENAAAKEAAKKAADEMVAAYRSGSKLETLAAANENAKYYSYDDASYSGESVTEWLFDSARKAGDSAVLDNGGSTYYVTVFHDRFREEYNTVNVRHILIAPETTTMSKDDAGYEDEVARLKAEATAKAEDILAQWQSGEATEASFAALALENSTDGGSKYNGGLYTQVYQGQMVPTFNDWCFDASRKAGDTGVVETDYGTHVMYFVGKDLPRWQVLVSETLKNDDITTWFTGMSTKYTAEKQDFGAKFVG